MGLTKVKDGSNMYQFLNEPNGRGYTWNPIKGQCGFNCSYCYVKDSRAKRFYQGKPHLVSKELDCSLGKNNFIFVGSMIDIWHDSIPDKWLGLIMEKCMLNSSNKSNKYLFQSKNPGRFYKFAIPSLGHFIYGTTAENNQEDVLPRCLALERLHRDCRVPTFVSIEPIMNFNSADGFAEMIKIIKPEFVVIGADSKNHHLPEPSPEKIEALIKELRKFTKVISKSNLKRLYEEK